MAQPYVRAATILLLAASFACSSSEFQSTPEDRAALFEYIYDATLEREAFSPVKDSILGIDIADEMSRFRDELTEAETAEELYYALVKISNARKDRHLSVSLIDGGLTLSDTAGTYQSNYPVSGSTVLHAPITFAADFGGGPPHPTDLAAVDYAVFVADYAEDIGNHIIGEPPIVGDEVITVNGMSIADYVAAVEPYHRYSTTNGFWWQFATWLPQLSRQFPPSVYKEQLELELQRGDGTQYQLALPYVDPSTISWSGFGERHYPDFDFIYSTESYDLYLSDRYPVVLLSWHGFREDLVEATDRLMAYASEHDLLDHALIVDATRSRGGSLGAYAVRRLSPKPFKTTFGNLKISDASTLFAEGMRLRYSDSDARYPAPELDDGSWLVDWIETDVAAAIANGDAYTNNVPFKNAHAPRDSDGIIQPADVHFTGPMICWFSPRGGSHLDQFASIVVDNELAYTMGMPAGGYSNTWEWEEDLMFPISGKPVVQFMWSIGHSIRPNGEILEGNPALVDEYIPVTRENYESYHTDLLRRSLARLGY